MLFIHLHLCEYCTGITHRYPLLIWRMCKYVGKINKLFVRILIEDRGCVLSKTTNRKTMHWNEKAKLMLCAKDPFHFFFVGKTGPELPMFASDAPSFLAKGGFFLFSYYLYFLPRYKQRVSIYSRWKRSVWFPLFHFL